MDVIPYIILYSIPVFISAVLAVVGWHHRDAPGTRMFSCLMIAVTIWSACHTLSVASSTLASVRFWALAQYVGIVAVPPLWLLFALAYSNHWRWVTRTNIALLIGVATATLIAVLSNHWHHLWWPSVQLDTRRAFGSLAITRGPLFWAHTVYSYGCVLFGLVLFTQVMFESQLVYRRQARMVVLGALFPIIGNIVYLFGFQLRAIDDPTPFLFTASGLTMYYATRHFHLLDLAPMAQHEIFEEMPDGVIVLDQRGIIAAVNASAARLMQIRVSSWTGRSIHELIESAPLAAELRAILQPPLAGGAHSATVRAADGSAQVIEARLRQVQHGSRGRIGSLLLLRDVTQRAMMEHKLDRQLTELQLLHRIGSSANAASQTDDLLRIIAAEILDTLKWDRVLICTLAPAGETIQIALDQAAPDLPHLQLLDVAPNVAKSLIELIHTSTTRVITIHDPAINGDESTAMRQAGLQTLLFVPLRQRDQALGGLLIGLRTIHTITESDLHFYETIGQIVSDAITRTELYEAAHAANALKSAFLATVSHELRSPLTSIIGFTDMMKQGVFGRTPEQLVEPIGHINNSGHTLLHLINDILDFSKMEAGHFSVDLYPIELAASIQKVANTMQPQIYARGLQLVLHIPAQLPLIYANSTRLEQVLTNLLANAIKFTDQGAITVSAALCADRVRISVQDTGIGIGPEDQQQLFQAFYQVNNELTRYGGTGLGLAISRRLVELMNGTLSVESTLHVGSTFVCELQLAPANLQQAEVLEQV